MSGLRKSYCIFGCDRLVAHSVPLHRFPNPDKSRDLFSAWVSALGDKLKENDPIKVYKSKRICDHHFDPAHKTTGGRLIISAVPTINLNRVKQSPVTIVEMEHNYDGSRRQILLSRTMADITNLPRPTEAKTSSTIGLENIPGPPGSGVVSEVHLTELSFPSGSTSMTCFKSQEKCHGPLLIKFDADKTLEYMQKKKQVKPCKKGKAVEE